MASDRWGPARPPPPRGWRRAIRCTRTHRPRGLRRSVEERKPQGSVHGGSARPRRPHPRRRPTRRPRPAGRGVVVAHHCSVSWPTGRLPIARPTLRELHRARVWHGDDEVARHWPARLRAALHERAGVDPITEAALLDRRYLVAVVPMLRAVLVNTYGPVRAHASAFSLLPGRDRRGARSRLRPVVRVAWRGRHDPAGARSTGGRGPARDDRAPGSRPRRRPDPAERRGGRPRARPGRHQVVDLRPAAALSELAG